mgnify:CR=1 FL=1
MAIQFTVIGLDQIGVSFGLALADYKDKIYRRGHDPVPTRARKIDPAGAFEKIHYRLSEAVKDADVVLISLPVDEIESVLKDLAQDLKDGVIVIDTSRASEAVSGWAAQYLPTGSHFISMIPAINGKYMQENSLETQSAHADLFKNSEMVIVTAPDTQQNAVNLVSELTEIMGAHAYFIDTFEADGIHARVDLLPKLVASALLLNTMQRPGWQDARRLASIPYAAGTDAIRYFSESEHPGDALLSNRENLVTALDDMIASLAKFRSLIDAKDAKTLDELLLSLKEDHTEWLDLRRDGDWDESDREPAEKPAGIFKRLLGDPGRLIKK